MFVTSEADRAGIFVAVISGGRPALKDRPTHKFLAQLKEHGFTNIAWIVAEHHADEYERDEHEIVSYPSQWAADYAAEHWMHTDPVPGAGGFHGAFPGREWACLEAERRGCWAVLQLDDNIISLSMVMLRGGGGKIVEEHGGLASHADFLAGFMKSTNGWMVGANLSSIPEPEKRVIRTGFCYSLFLERVGEGREHWYGPFEDDITHAFQYGTRADGAAPLLVPLINYTKESKSSSGMRKHYNHKRAVQLQRIFPESARIGVRRTTSNGLGDARVFHSMSPTAIRNPLVVKDKALYNQTVKRLNALLEVWAERSLEHNRAKIAGRIEKIKTKGGGDKQ